MLHRFTLLTILLLALSLVACNGNDDDNDDSDDDNDDNDDDDDSSDDDDDDFNLPDGWRMELVDDNKAGQNNKIELLSNIQPIISYHYYNYEKHSRVPQIAQFLNNMWIITQISIDNAESSLCFLLDRFDNIHLGLENYGNPIKTLYTTNITGSWNTKTVAEIVRYGSSRIDMALNSQNKPYFIYEDDYTNEDSLFLSKWNGDSWNNEYLVKGDDPRIAIDSNDNFHIVYTLPDDNNYKDELFYLTNATGEWVTTKIDDTDDCEGEPGYSALSFSGHQIEIDDQDNIHLAYTVSFYKDVDSQSGWDGQTKYVEIGAGGKSAAIVENHTYLKGLALDGDSDPHLLLGKKEEDRYLLHVYSKSGSTWESINLGIESGDSDLEVDQDGYIHISFADLDDLDVPIALYYLTNRPL